MATAAVRTGTPAARWILFATVLGSGVAFLDSTVVNVALPAIERDLDAGVSGLQWTVDAYLVTLSAFLLVGGALGDLHGRRRMFVIGLVLFTVASALCGLAPNIGALIGARAVQGIGAALLVPESLAIISAAFASEDRGAAIGAWSGLSGLSTAAGPFVAGWLIDISWRLVFLINLPLAAMAIYAAVRHVPETRDEEADPHIDLPGAVVVAVGLGALAYGLIEEVVAVTVAGLIALVVFVVIEARHRNPLLPLSVFRSTQFSGANLMTLFVYTAPSGAFFLLALLMQQEMGYSPLEAGAAFLPSMVLMLLLSSRAGRVAQRIGPQLPMTIGPAVLAVGLVMLAEVGPGDDYLTGVFPGVVVFGLGLSILVGPLTAAVLAAVEERHLGVGSAFNNAVARTAGLLAVAVLPGVADLGGNYVGGFPRAMRVLAVLSVIGGLFAFATIRRALPQSEPAVHPAPDHACGHPQQCERSEAA